MRALVAAGADVNATASDGTSLLMRILVMLSTARERFWSLNERVFRVLLELRADPNLVRTYNP